jgi:putative hydrolase of the HAD superfamily
MMGQPGTPDDGHDGGQPVKAVFFDVEGTLWDVEGCARQVMDIILPHFKDHLPVEDPEEVIRQFNAAFFEQVSAEHLRERRPFSRLKRFEALLDSYGVKRRGMAADMCRKYDSARRLVMRQFLRPEALSVLTELGRRGLKRGVIVNGTPAVQRHLIQSIGLAPYMDYVVLAEVEGYSKPDVRIFKRALELAQLQPEQAFYVGDSALTDILGAARAGMPAVWYNPDGRRRLPSGFPAPDLTISSLAELPAVLGD